MTLCPFAQWMPVVNHSGPVDAHHGLVIHVAEGDGSIYGWANNPASQVSAHFWCGKDGTLQQLVDTDDAAWAEEAGNYYWTSVETEGYATEALTDAQIATLGRLYAWGHQTYGWPLQTADHDGTGLTTHAHYPSQVPDPSWGDHPCPGALRSPQLPAILAAAETVLGEKTTTPTPPTSTSTSPTPTSEEDDVNKNTLIVTAKAPSTKHTVEGNLFAVSGLAKLSLTLALAVDWANELGQVLPGQPDALEWPCEELDEIPNA